MEIIGSGDLTAGKKIIAENFANWTSGNEIIDNFIQEKQLNYDASYTKYGDIKAVFEWIPYNELIGIKELGKSCFATAIWKEGPLFHCERENEWMKKSYEFVTLKFLYDLQNITDEFINKVKSKSGVIFGISQNPDTEVYLLVICDKYFDHYCKCGNVYDQSYYKWCKECRINQLKNNFTNWTSGNIIFDHFIQKMQLKISKYYDTVFEWIPYNEIIIIEELEHYTSAIWKKGPLYYTDDKKLVRKSYEKVYLKYLYNSQEITDEFSNEVESYLKSGVIFGISQNPDTKVHILVFYNEYLICYCEKCGNKYENRIYKWCKQCEINQLKNNFTNWTNRNEKVDNFIQKMQLNINDYHDKIFEWISYNKFIIIKELENYSLAIWEKDNTNDQKSVGKSREKVYLKYLYNSQEITADFSNEVESYLENKVIFGISQNPDTEVYLLVFNVEYFDRYCEKCGNEYDDIKYKWCEQCQMNYLKNNFTDWTSGNEKVDNFIQKMQLKVNVYQGGIFEWISYNEFIEIKEIENNVLATAIWKDGPLYYSSIRMSYNREINIKVILKYLCNSQNVSHLSLSEVIYSVKENYGITQNPNTKDYMLVCKIEYYCEICGKKYNNQFERNNKSCISCQTNHENKKIHDLIQEIKLNIDHNSGDFDIMFEWIPYDQFNDIKEIGKGGFSTVYSAIWKDGVLFYDCNPFKTGWKRQSNTKVALKCLNNSQNFLDEFVNEV
ncbi:hypothetical protein GLOIN_2v275216 [Rhizophagus irregularis DAOM 181602=DAOM 197198]|uniref:Protein kinase domain-containing protein n=1 Tax=Rhizophagus irregularis (strain DAOM 181602 / DAOM 197198 / MUCL 43194) TaxID=747089 RepID=A0A2P4PQQ7_RHIID|nr:hypothetical protein GLOIN_2v275216 [Rhizophagus irregularis DAOM 181602=DAOM 197198]POG67725.1 hypothetical protein GLOIN_2v275216 [Rhizophagus irregularis DAOM 181602=DAOM 197198]|eukprot:XP_025174591.1 hypothetical protein GLOIN_2v275216 [Rhizophagus irregularis DAOM 181602=DAOM 197198]